LFQTLTKTGVGTLNISNAVSGLTTVSANAGTINVAAAGIGVLLRRRLPPERRSMWLAAIPGRGNDA
jgi:hypothetical protein